MKNLLSPGEETELQNILGRGRFDGAEGRRLFLPSEGDAFRYFELIEKRCKAMAGKAP
jgi:hypothetical protein